jgi:hypothetical protein
MSIQKLYIDQQIAEYPEVSSITRRLDIPAEIVANGQEVYDSISGAPDPEGENSTFFDSQYRCLYKKMSGHPFIYLLWL